MATCPHRRTSLEDFRAQIETNLFGVINSPGGAAGPETAGLRPHHPLAVGGGRVDRSPWRVRGGEVGVEGFSEVLAKEAGPLGVKVTIVEPVGSAPTSQAHRTSIHDGKSGVRATVASGRALSA